jgi:hypothetical protein
MSAASWTIVAHDAATGAELFRCSPLELLQANADDDDDALAAVAALTANPAALFFWPTHAGAVYLERVTP